MAKIIDVNIIAKVISASQSCAVSFVPDIFRFAFSFESIIRQKCVKSCSESSGFMNIN